MNAILLLAAAAAWLVAAAAAVGAARRAGLVAAVACSAAGGALALAGGIGIALRGVTAARTFGAGNVAGSLTLQLSPLAAAFIALLGLIALAIGLYAPRYHAPGQGSAFYLCSYNLALLASLGVLVAGNVVVFLVAWESMTLSSYLLIMRHHMRRGTADGGFQFLALGEAGFACIVAAFAILAVRTGSIDLAVIAARSHAIPGAWRSTAFVLALIGFGFKAGLVPLHVWLPEAHPVAPADGSGFLSGLVIKLGVYGVLLFAFQLLAGGPMWWGVLTVAIGAVTAVIGVLYAVIERDFKRLLAFHSIENIGIIITAAGAAMMFRAGHQPALGAYLLLAAIYHVVNHGTYKTLLFLEAGVIEHTTGTRDLDRLGGLVHRLRKSSVITLIGTLGIAGLPPLNGFVSEWLIFQGLFQGFRIQPEAGVVLVLAGAALALSGGLAVLAFAHAFGIAFLGLPRSRAGARAREDGQPIAGPALLAVACVALSVGAPAVLIGLDRIARAVTGVQLRPNLLLGHLTIIPAHQDFAAFSPTYLTVFLVAVSAVPVLIYLAGRYRPRARLAPVWDGGMLEFKPRMQYTGVAFANPTRVTFGWLYQPELDVQRASEDPAGRSGPVHYDFRVLPLFQRYLYDPVVRSVVWLARLIRPLQAGDVNVYLLYVFLVVVAVYVLHLVQSY
jgi:formate hydrogenlyase subunit 3/multisubunit Na+/H+ antiporter MnhD subunit